MKADFESSSTHLGGSRIEFYSQQMNRTDDPDGKAMYAYLVSQEKGHRRILEGEYDYLTGTGFWFDVQEFNLEG